MSNVGVEPVAESDVEKSGRTQWQRVGFIFSAPSKTFEDIKGGNRSWWLPFVLFIVVGTALWGSATVRVGWEQVVDNGLRFAPKQAEQLHSLTPAQQAKQITVGAMIQEVLWGLGPIWVLVFNVVAAAILLGTINFGFGGNAAFGEVLSVSWYAGLPGLIKLALGAISLWVGIAPESFLPGNPAGTNVGYYFSPSDMPMALWTLLTSFDATFIWTLVLFSKGLAKVAGTKPSSGYIAVFGWFVLYLLLQTGFASAFS